MPGIEVLPPKVNKNCAGGRSSVMGGTSSKVNKNCAGGRSSVMGRILPKSTIFVHGNMPGIEVLPPKVNKNCAGGRSPVMGVTSSKVNNFCAWKCARN